ncbi:orotate phosphoribosyltransferase [Paenibacillus turpanensis]|uniref:orotate phosphoribosyltransferase n=1 Tax=Paenibacillus turpanensis TaxID=2689078 RepID=UPI00140AA310|nr:orotate phosphoribosyltransferase [Paenibacillus turpanensis]
MNGTITVDLQKLPQQIAEALLKIKAVSLRPDPANSFVWTSGLKSPIYCDNRLTISYPEVRNLLADGFAALVKHLHPDAEVIAGIATGGIPHAAWVADKLGLPMIYVRDKAKGHGKQNMIEGHLSAGQKVVLIEDLISTGGSSLKAAVAVRDAGAQALGVVAIFTYEFPQAEQAFREENIPLATLSNYSALLETAAKLGAIAESDIKTLQSWREHPQQYGV